MQDEAYIRIPLRARDGSVRAYALIDERDRDLTQYRWSLQTTGYVQRRAGDTVVLLHRELLGLRVGDRKIADHINRDKLDNRRENLRVGSRTLNAQNTPARARTSQYRGVYRKTGDRMWQACVQVDGVVHLLGRFEDEAEAAAKARAFRAEHMPFAID